MVCLFVRDVAFCHLGEHKRENKIETIGVGRVTNTISNSSQTLPREDDHVRVSGEVLGGKIYMATNIATPYIALPKARSDCVGINFRPHATTRLPNQPDNSTTLWNTLKSRSG